MQSRVAFVKLIAKYGPVPVVSTGSQPVAALPPAAAGMRAARLPVCPYGGTWIPHPREAGSRARDELTDEATAELEMIEFLVCLRSHIDSEAGSVCGVGGQSTIGMMPDA